MSIELSVSDFMCASREALLRLANYLGFKHPDQLTHLQLVSRINTRLVSQQRQAERAARASDPIEESELVR